MAGMVSVMMRHPFFLSRHTITVPKWAIALPTLLPVPLHVTSHWHPRVALMCWRWHMHIPLHTIIIKGVGLATSTVEDMQFTDMGTVLQADTPTQDKQWLGSGSVYRTALLPSTMRSHEPILRM